MDSQCNPAPSGAHCVGSVCSGYSFRVSVSHCTHVKKTTYILIVKRSPHAETDPVSLTFLLWQVGSLPLAPPVRMTVHISQSGHGNISVLPLGSVIDSYLY